VDIDRWVLVDISEIPGAFVPDDEPGLSREQREQARRRLREQPPEQKARLEQASHEFPDFGQRWHAIRQNLGITAFGMNANEETQVSCSSSRTTRSSTATKRCTSSFAAARASISEATRLRHPLVTCFTRALECSGQRLRSTTELSY
jgi:hypothetical protein